MDIIDLQYFNFRVYFVCAHLDGRFIYFVITYITLRCLFMSYEQLLYAHITMLAIPSNVTVLYSESVKGTTLSFRKSYLWIKSFFSLETFITEHVTQSLCIVEDTYHSCKPIFGFDPIYLHIFSVINYRLFCSILTE
jgi:hypothetical protein